MEASASTVAVPQPASVSMETNTKGENATAECVDAISPVSLPVAASATSVEVVPILPGSKSRHSAPASWKPRSGEESPRVGALINGDSGRQYCTNLVANMFYGDGDSHGMFSNWNFDVSVSAATSSLIRSSTAARNEWSEIEEHLVTARRFTAKCCTPRTWLLQSRDWVLGTSEGHFIALLILGVCLIAFGALCWHFTGGNDDYDTSLKSSFWIAWGLFFDPGTQTGFPPDDPAIVLWFGCLFSVVGFIFNVTVLGTVVEFVRTLLRNFKDMYSRILCKGHILVLGWGDKTLLLLTELLAEDKKETELVQSKRKGMKRCMPRWCRGRNRQIVILAQRPVVDMKQDVQMHMKFERQKYGQIAFREGSPRDRSELLKVSAHQADCLLIIGEGQSENESDQMIIQILLALGALPGVAKLSGDVFAEMQTNQSVVVARTMLPVVEGIVARYAVNRILVLRAINSSIGYTYLQLASFRRGNEIYVTYVPKKLVGKTLRELGRLYPEAVLLGFFPGGQERFGCEFDRPVMAGDQIMSIATNLSAANYYATSQENLPPNQGVTVPKKKPDLLQSDGQLLLGSQTKGLKTVVVIGCPGDLPNILEALDCYLAAGSAVHVLSSRTLEMRTEVMCSYFGPRFPDGKYKRIKVFHSVGSTTSMHCISELPLHKASSVLILAESRSLDESPLAVDSRSLSTVVCVRGLLRALDGKKKVKVVTELLDPKTSQVLEGNSGVRQLGSFVYSNAVTTGVFATAATEKTAYTLFKDLLDPESNFHIVAVPVSDVIFRPEVLNFYQVQGLVEDMFGGILLGWRRSECRYPIVNPANKSQSLSWKPGDGSDELIILTPHVGCGTPRNESALPNGNANFFPPGAVQTDQTEDPPAAVYPRHHLGW